MPEDFETFFNPPPPEEEKPDADADAGKGKKGKDKKDAKGKDKKDKKDAKGKGKKGKAAEPPEPIKPPPLTGKTAFTEATVNVLDQYETTWMGRDEQGNYLQRHDEELVRNTVRPDVEAEVRQKVKEMLTMHLENFKKQVSPLRLQTVVYFDELGGLLTDA